MADTASKKKYHKTTILQVLPELHTGGVERGTVDISRELVKQGFRSIVISNGGHLSDLIKQSGGIHYKMPVHSKNPFVIYKNINRIANIIKKEKVDLIHGRSRAPAWSCYYAAKKCKIPFVTTFHGFYKFSNIFKKFYNSIMTKGYMVIAVSEFIKEYILSKYTIPVDNIEVIHRGVDLDLFSPEKVTFQRMNNIVTECNIPEDKTIICLPGRVSRWKGHHVLINALSLVNSKNFHCIFVGDYNKKPKYKNELIDLIKEKNLVDNVSFTGNIRDMASAYKLSDIIVSASTEPEAFGRVAIEGQAMKKIVIASNIGGSKETIKDGKTGFLFESSNHEDLAKKIEKILNMDTQEIQNIGDQARTHILANFSLDLMLNKTIDLYKKAIESFRD